MAIQSVSEFEAILMQVANRIEKELVALGSQPILERARDDIRRFSTNTRDAKKRKDFLKRMNEISDQLSELIKEEKLLNQLWDLVDFIEYN
ncbi:MAG: hypothetical protein U0414_15885 [Polyangiaceae bacterium]